MLLQWKYIDPKVKLSIVSKNPTAETWKKKKMALMKDSLQLRDQASGANSMGIQTRKKAKIKTSIIRNGHERGTI